jgi:hypothetical protein
LSGKACGILFTTYCKAENIMATGDDDSPNFIPIINTEMMLDLIM